MFGPELWCLTDAPKKPGFDGALNVDITEFLGFGFCFKDICFVIFSFLKHIPATSVLSRLCWTAEVPNKFGALPTNPLHVDLLCASHFSRESISWAALRGRDHHVRLRASLHDGQMWSPPWQIHGLLHDVSWKSGWSLEHQILVTVFFWFLKPFLNYFWNHFCFLRWLLGVVNPTQETWCRRMWTQLWRPSRRNAPSSSWIGAPLASSVASTISSLEFGDVFNAYPLEDWKILKRYFSNWTNLGFCFGLRIIQTTSSHPTSQGMGDDDWGHQRWFLEVIWPRSCAPAAWFPTPQLLAIDQIGSLEVLLLMWLFEMLFIINKYWWCTVKICSSRSFSSENEPIRWWRWLQIVILMDKGWKSNDQLVFFGPFVKCSTNSHRQQWVKLWEHWHNLLT